MLTDLIILAIVLYIIWRFFRWKIHEDTLMIFTGGLGAGKSYMSAVTVKRAYRKQMKKWRQRKHLPGYEKPPLVYSSIPYKYARDKWAVKLTEEHLLLQRRIRPLSVVFLDEIDVFANQFHYNNPCIINQSGGRLDGNFDEFCRLFRHYTRGGRLISNSQSIDNLNLVIRRRMNVEVNLTGLKVYTFPPILQSYKVMFRHRTGNVEVTDSKKDILNDYQPQRGLMLLPFRMYDTYCYSRRYDRVPYKDEETYTEWKKDDPLVAPKGHVPKLTEKRADEHES